MNIERPPMIKLDEDSLIFLYDLEGTGGFRFRIWNFRRDRLMSKSGKIQPLRESDSPMIFNSVYAFHPKQKKIYFIVKNKRVVTLDIETEVLEEVGSIHTTLGNVAALSFMKSSADAKDVEGQMYILGAEELDGVELDEGKADDGAVGPIEHCILVPYSACVQKVTAKERVEHIQFFGHFTRVMNVGAEIWLMGGEGKFKEDGFDAPTDSFFVYDTKAKEWVGQRFLIYPLHSMAVINMDNQYLLTIGGTRQKGDEDREEREDGEAIRNLYAMPLQADLEGGMEQYYWYEVNQCDIAVECCGVLMEGDTLVHLFTKDGVHWTVPTPEIYSRLMVEHCRKKNIWREQGKDVMPTKSKSIKNMGPKGGDESD